MKQQTKKKWLAKLLIFAMLISTCIVGDLNITANAADIETYQYSGSYGQTEARSMLAMINDFRTGSDTWYWNPDNTTKTQLPDLTPLVYDYNLEKIAMQRAAEIVASFEHTRPNGESCWSLKEGTTGSSAENIAIGQRTAASAFTTWLEADEPYSGQGHRRNMLGVAAATNFSMRPCA